MSTMISPFGFAPTPRVVFRPGAFDELPEIVRDLGRVALVVTGQNSYQEGGRWERLLAGLGNTSVTHFHVTVPGEPSPKLVDETIKKYQGIDIEVVVAWGGGSVIDAGKALSAMLTQKGSVTDYLEGVGTRSPDGTKVPFIAVPTTAGTGSEATKNAVLSQVGPGGFKKSLRHDNFVPDLAVLDPLLALSCPAAVTAACGMDAFTQLLESYVSTKASPMTDALALSGLTYVARHLVAAATDASSDPQVRGGMAYAALMSGVTLANAGLGVVHGLASPLGGAFAIPHGVACGTLIGAATKITIQKLNDRFGTDHVALAKFARAGALLAGVEGVDVKTGCALLVERINAWTQQLNLPRLGAFGIGEQDLDRIVAGAGIKNHPIPLEPEEIRDLLTQRL